MMRERREQKPIIQNVRFVVRLNQRTENRNVTKTMIAEEPSPVAPESDILRVIGEGGGNELRINKPQKRKQKKKHF